MLEIETFKYIEAQSEFGCVCFSVLDQHGKNKVDISPHLEYF